MLVSPFPHIPQKLQRQITQKKPKIAFKEPKIANKVIFSVLAQKKHYFSRFLLKIAMSDVY